MIEEKVHSKVGASSSERWMSCPGSVRMCEGRPGRSTEYTAEGTAAHHVAERCLKENKDALDFFGDIIEVDDFEFEVDETMVEHVQLYVDTIRADAKEMGDATLEVERGFHLKSYHPDLFGTNDANLYSATVLRVYDFKYGAGKPVEMANNPQLKIYALGALETCPATNVELIIVQPRAAHKDGPVRRWRTTLAELREWAEEVLVPAVKATEAPDAPLVPDKETCKWCNGVEVCPALRKRTAEVLDVEFDEAHVPAVPPPQLPPVESLTPEQVSRILEFKPLAEQFFKAVYNRAKDTLEQDPNAIPGFKLVEGRGKRQWVDEAEVKSGALFTVLKQDIYDVKLKSVAQMEKALKQAGHKPAAYLEDLVTVSRGLQVVPEYDNRQAYVPAEQMFPEEYDPLEDF